MAPCCAKMPSENWMSVGAMLDMAKSSHIVDVFLIKRGGGLSTVTGETRVRLC